MGGMFMGSDGWDDEEEGEMDPMAAMMGGEFLFVSCCDERHGAADIRRPACPAAGMGGFGDYEGAGDYGDEL